MTLHKPMRRPKLMLQKLLVALIVLSMFSLPTQAFAQDTGDGTDGSDGRAPNIFLPMLSDGSVESADMSADAEAAYNNDDGDDDAASKAIFFVADGLRQDMVEKYAAQRNVMPNMRTLLRNGVKAAGDGLLTQAPPNTGAGWYSLATGAWPGVHGSTNNTFHINGQPFTSRTAAFDLGVLQAESLAQAAERGGKKVAQIEWAGGREAIHPGTDGRLPHLPLGPRRRHQLHQPHRRCRLRGLVWPPVRPPGRLCRPGALRRRGAHGCQRLDQCAEVVQPGQGNAAARARLRHRQVRPQRLHLRLDATTTRWTTTACCSPSARTAARPWAC